MMNLSKPPKVAFYPCCETDFEEPLLLLGDLASKVIFCDVKDYSFRMHNTVRRLKHQQPDLMIPTALFYPMDIRDAILVLRRIDILFYRRDSFGEGGSEIPILYPHFLPLLLAKFPDEGGIIVTDGSNSDRSHDFMGIVGFDIGDPRAAEFYRLGTPEEQPWYDSHGLNIISVQRHYR